MASCIDFTGVTDKDGYGLHWADGTTRRAHRTAYIRAHGLTFDDIKGKTVMHTCDRPCCVNAEHLHLGTQKENIQDMLDKGRRAPTDGESNGNARLTYFDVQQIHKRYIPSVVSHKMLAEHFGVSRSMIGMILAGKRWPTL